MEVEAESVVYLVAHRRPITLKSLCCLAGCVQLGSSLADLRLYAI